jgi:hypothetical protein
LAIVFRKAKIWVGVYIVSELILAVPTVLLLVVSLCEGVRYAPNYLFVGLFVFVMFTVLPLCWAIGLLRLRKLA